MRTLYTFDKHNYSDDMEVFERFAVRAVIIRDGKLAMQQAGEGYYKILGGGIDAGETNEVALAREVRGGRASCRAGKHKGVRQGHRKET